MNYVRSQSMQSFADYSLASRATSKQNCVVVDDCETAGSTKRMSEVVCSPYLPVHGELCETCHFSCANKTELWKHVRSEHDADQRLICPKPCCGKRFSSLATSVSHMAHHRVANERPLVCELCGHLLGNLRTFGRHMSKLHPDAMAAMCGVCHLYMGDVPSLIDHVRRQHETSAAIGETITAVGTESATSTVASVKKQHGEQMRPVYNGNCRNIHKHREVFTISTTPASGACPSAEVATEQRYQPVSDNVCEICDAYCTDKTELFKYTRDEHGVSESLDVATGTSATVGTSTATGTISARIQQRVKQVRHDIRCDVCGKRYGNYKNMYKHRVVHGTVEFNSRSPFVTRSFLRHKSNKLQPY